VFRVLAPRSAQARALFGAERRRSRRHVAKFDKNLWSQMQHLTAAMQLHYRSRGFSAAYV
jgi:hypothetical protein